MITRKAIIDAISDSRGVPLTLYPGRNPLSDGCKWIYRHLATSNIYSLKDKRGKPYKKVCSLGDYVRALNEMLVFGGAIEYQAYSQSEKQPLTKENSDYSFYKENKMTNEKKMNCPDCCKQVSSTPYGNENFPSPLRNCDECGQFTGGPKESANKHPHHDLIAEWAKDTRKEILIKCKRTDEWEEASIYLVLLDTSGHREFKPKPREFQEGHWYPCLHKEAGVTVKFFSDGVFNAASQCDGFKWIESEFIDIGESLGKIEFGGK